MSNQHHGGRPCHQGGRPCGDPRCKCKRIVHPTMENVVMNCTKERVEHVFPSHTTVVNEHLIDNQYFYPHTTSQVNNVNETHTNRRPGQGQVSPGYQGPGNQGQGQGGYGCNRPRPGKCCNRPRPNNWC